MSATLILKCDEPIVTFTGEALSEPDPGNPGKTRSITTGRFLSQFVALGKGQPENKIVECQALAMELYGEAEVPLSPDDAMLILAVLKRGFADGQIFAWVVGHFQYLLDPKSVPEATRERMARHYATRAPVVTAVGAAAPDAAVAAGMVAAKENGAGKEEAQGG